MVARRRILTLLLGLATALPLAAQNYAPGDTVTEYPQKGTYYHNRFEGRKTASGEVFDQNLFTAAHWKIKLGTMVMVTNRNTGLQVIVKVNDRCPRRGVFDMSHRAANAIGIKGCQPVTVRLLPEGYEEQWAGQDAMFDSVYSKFSKGKSSSTKANAKRSESPKEAKATVKEKEEPPKATAKKSGEKAEQQYNILLGAAQTHGEAFSMIEQLPQIYREKALLDTLGGNGQIYVLLQVNLPEKKARELNRSLRRTFKGCRVTPSE